jgi:LuxR family maltose regulon positive regulatory protein
LQAELRRVKARCERIIAQYTTRMGAVSPLMLPLATVHYQRNELDNAEDLLREAITIAQMANLPDTVLFGHVALADILLVRGQTKAAENSLVQARHFARNYESPMLDSYINAAMARFWLRSGKLEQALHWSEQYQQADEAHYNHDYEDLTLAQVWLAQGAYEHTREHLNTVISRAGAAGRVKTVLEAQVLNVLVHRAEGDTETALDVLEKVLALAQPHGFVRLFLDAGEPLLRLLRTISQRTSSEKIAAYARTLSTATVEPQADQHPADVLTERELEVLQCLAEGASNKAIAEMLVISLGTAKSHIHHIMSKLDVRNRTEAVSKARTMGLLD